MSLRSKLYAFFFTLALAVITVTVAPAQESKTIEGKVIMRSSSTVTPLKGALVYLFDHENNRVATTTTDGLGYFSFTNLSDDKYYVKAELAEYEFARREVIVDEGVEDKAAVVIVTMGRN